MVLGVPCGTASASDVFDERAVDEICSVDCRTIVNTLAYGLCADWTQAPMDWHSVVAHIAGHLNDSRWTLSVIQKNSQI